MTILAHPDDAEIWAGGSIAKWNSKGGFSKIVCFVEDFTREKEAVSGAKVLGAQFEMLRGSSKATKKTISCVKKVLIDFAPDILMTHHFNDSHSEHRDTFSTLSGVLPEVRITTGKPKMLLAVNTYNELCLGSVFNPDVYIDISRFMDKKMSAIARHSSQPYKMWQKIAKNQNALLGSRLSNVEFAEGFIELPILGKLATRSLF